MNIHGKIIGHRIDSYKGKNGDVVTFLTSVLDQDGPTLLVNTVDIASKTDEMHKLPVMSDISVEVNNFKYGFDDRLRFDLVKYNTRPAPSPAKQ